MRTPGSDISSDLTTELKHPAPDEYDGADGLKIALPIRVALFPVLAAYLLKETELFFAKTFGVVVAGLALLTASTGQAAPAVDAHIYAEDVAREIATLLKPGARVQIQPSTDYFQMGVIAQLRTRGYILIPAGSGTGEPLQYSLTESTVDGNATVNLVVSLNTYVRNYATDTGRPKGEWSKLQPISRTPTLLSAQSEQDELYTLGRAVESASPPRALTYYRMAADLGQIDASLRLGLLLISQNKPTEAIPFIQKASNAGDAKASYVLGVALLNGTGVPKNIPKARALLLLARDRGFAAAAELLATLPAQP